MTLRWGLRKMSLRHPVRTPLGSYSPRILLYLGLFFCVLFLVWTSILRMEGFLVALDFQIAQDMEQISQAHPSWRGIMVFFTHVGDVSTHAIFLFIGAMTWFLTTKDWRYASAWILIVASGGLTNTGIKMLVDRQRPPAEIRDIAVTQTNESYPSGHAMGGVIGYGMLAYTLMRLTSRAAVRWLIFFLFVALVGMIGYSRFFLRAHWFSDVLAGYFLGLGFLLLCLYSWEVRSSWRQPIPPDTTPPSDTGPRPHAT